MSQYLALVKPTAPAYGAGRMDTRRGGGLPAVGVGRKGNSVTCALQQRIGQIGPAAFEIGILLV